jgi:23S rRNA C2498 (ribose-2'-O)-methylase RlmM
LQVTSWLLLVWTQGRRRVLYLCCWRQTSVGKYWPFVQYMMRVISTCFTHFRSFAIHDRSVNSKLRFENGCSKLSKHVATFLRRIWRQAVRLSQVVRRESSGAKRHFDKYVYVYFLDYKYSCVVVSVIVSSVSYNMCIYRYHWGASDPSPTRNRVELYLYYP